MMPEGNIEVFASPRHIAVTLVLCGIAYATVCRFIHRRLSPRR